MQFQHTVKKAKFLKRYKRFFADIEIDGKVEVAHVANTGSMKGCIEPNSECLVTYNDDPTRKLKYTLQLIKTPTSWVGVNTSLPNSLVHELWEKRTVPHWEKYDHCQKEVTISKETRLDMAMYSSLDKHELKKERLAKLRAPLHFIEIKNVTLELDGVARFPDSETTRGQKHITELMGLIKKGYTCEIVFVVQRQDCKEFSPADDIDAKYGELLREAAAQGLKISAFPTISTEKGIELQPISLPIRL